MCTVPSRGRGWAEWTTLAGQHGDQRWGGRLISIIHECRPAATSRPPRKSGTAGGLDGVSTASRSRS